MALVQCPDCKGRVSGKATVCIKCGLPLDEFTAVFSWGTLLTSLGRFVLAVDGLALGVVFYARGAMLQGLIKAPGTYIDILKTTESNIFLGSVFLVLGFLISVSGFKNFSTHMLINREETDIPIQLRDWQYFGILVTVITLMSDIMCHWFNFHFRDLVSFVSIGFLTTVLVLFHIQLWSLALVISSVFGKNTGIRRPVQGISILSKFIGRFSYWFSSSEARQKLAKVLLTWLLLCFFTYCIQALTAKIPRTRQVVWFTNEKPLTPVRPFKKEPI